MLLGLLRWSSAISTRVFCIRGQKSHQSERQSRRPWLVLPIEHNIPAFLLQCLTSVTNVCGICMSALLLRMHAVMIAQSCRQAHTACVGIVSMSVGTCCAPLGAMSYCQGKHAQSRASPQRQVLTSVHCTIVLSSNCHCLFACILKQTSGAANN